MTKRQQFALILVSGLVFIGIAARLLILPVDMVAEYVHCLNKRLHASSSIDYTFRQIDDECTFLHFYPFYRKR